MIKSDIEIKGKRIYLRPLKISDASQRYCSWINNQEINRYLDSKKITIEKLEEYIDKRYNFIINQERSEKKKEEN